MKVDIDSVSALLAGLRFVLAFILLFFAPGIIWSPLLFPKRERAEGIAFSIVFSVAGLTVFIFLANLLAGLPVSDYGVLSASLFLCACGLIAKRLWKRK